MFSFTLFSENFNLYELRRDGGVKDTGKKTGKEEEKTCVDVFYESHKAKLQCLTCNVTREVVYKSKNLGRPLESTDTY